MIKKEAKTTISISDQRTDRSGAVLTKIAHRMTDQGLAKLALDTFSKMARPAADCAQFPCDTPEDVLLSRIYLAGQRDKFSEEEAKKMEEKFAVMSELMGVNAPIHMDDEPAVAAEEKTASYELLPMCKVASCSDVEHAASDFCLQYKDMRVADRYTFCDNLTKAASELGVELPEFVNLFSGENITHKEDLTENILFRKVAMDRAGKDSTLYADLYNTVLSTDFEKSTPEELRKFAALLENIDNSCDVMSTAKGKYIPNAWDSVLRVKTAEEVAPTDIASTMTKAEIVNRYGNGILEEVEDAEGEIDKSKLRKLMQLAGDPVTETSESGDTGVK